MLLQKKVTSALLFLDNDDEWIKTTTRELSIQFAGWLVFDLPSVISVSSKTLFQ